MTNEDKRHGSGYMSGFVMGALVGSAAVFFFGTKKGKKTAKLMSQTGSKTLKDLEKLAHEIEEKGETFAKKAKVVTKKLEKQTKSNKKKVTVTAKKKLTHIKKLQNRGRAAAARYFQKA